MIVEKSILYFNITNFCKDFNIILFHQSAIIKSVCQINVDIGVNIFAATNEVQTIRKLGMQTTFIRRTPSKLPIDVVENDTNLRIHSLNIILTR